MERLEHLWRVKTPRYWGFTEVSDGVVFCAPEASLRQNRIGWVVCWLKAHLGGRDVAQHQMLGNCSASGVMLLMGRVPDWPTGVGVWGKGCKESSEAEGQCQCEARSRG